MTTTPEIATTLALSDWRGPFPLAVQQDAVRALEDGKVLFLPQLPFVVGNSEADLLDPAISAAGRKNISRDPASGDLGNAALGAADATRLGAMLARFATLSGDFMRGLFPAYASALEIGRTSFRPVEIEGREYSARHDDRRLHIDAFPSRPLRGKRILRLFANIASDGSARRWQVGEPFADFAARFAPRAGAMAPGSAWLMERTGITKGRRSAYDHVMLRLHDGAKLDADYQRGAPKHDLNFPPNTVWLCFTDQVLHAALAGHAALEQTFYLPVDAMTRPATAPLRVLERLMGRSLV